MHRATLWVLLICVPAVCCRAQSSVPVHARVTVEGDFADVASDAQRAAIQAHIDANLRVLERRGVSSHSNAAQGISTSLAWPLKPTPAFLGFDYHGVSNFVDHGPPFPGNVQDYTCGTHTYNVQGYNHAGTDYFIWPFPWLMMDQEQVSIVAAAPGIIVFKSDGNFDRDCALSNSAQWNAVYVQHADGSVAWYGHMKSGSQTTKPIGASVAAGEYLGSVGSSGSSTGPHLHFELHDAQGAIVDPRHGQCNASPDLWTVFQPYEEPKINSLSTHAPEPQFVDCGVDGLGHAQAETPNFKNTFSAGDTFWIFSSYHDQRDGEVTHYSILRPDGSAFAAWDFDSAEQHQPNAFYDGSAWEWQYVLPADAPIGAWKVQAVFQGQTYVHEFSVGASIPSSNYAARAAARAQVAAAAARCRPRAGQPAVCKP